MSGAMRPSAQCFIDEDWNSIGTRHCQQQRVRSETKEGKKIKQLLENNARFYES